MKFGLVISCYKRKHFIKKFYKNCNLKASSRPFYVFKELSTISLLENEIIEATYIKYVIVKLSKFAQISTHTSSDLLLLKRAWN